MGVLSSVQTPKLGAVLCSYVRTMVQLIRAYMRPELVCFYILPLVLSQDEQVCLGAHLLLLMCQNRCPPLR